MNERVEDPRTLVSFNSFDIGAKVLYARHYLQGVQSDYAERLYEHHLKVWNGLRELHPPKEGLAAYVEAFQGIISDIRDGSFDFEKSPIPINARGKIINGRHRLAAAIACGSPVRVKEYPDSAGFEVCDYPFLKVRDLSVDYGDAMATEYARISPNTYIATVFAHHTPEQILDKMRLYGVPIYWKQISLTGEGPFNLMRELYLDEEWVEGWEKGFIGARGKARCTLSENKAVGVYLFECESLERVLECKKALRSQFAAGQHALHMNDTHQQTLQLAGVLLNRNSLHFLNRSRFASFPQFQTMFEEYRNFLRDKNPEEYCIDGSAVLAAYGLRECRDLDFIACNDDPGPSPLIDNHNRELHHHNLHRDDLLFNPENYFWHSGVKFISLAQIRAMKKKRDEKKDRKDITLMKRCEPSWRERVANFMKRVGVKRNANM